MYVEDEADEMTEILFTVEQADDGGWIAVAVGVSIVTEADTLEELRANVREAVDVHFDTDVRPKLIRLHIVQDEVMAT